MIVEFKGGIIAAASGTLCKSKHGTRVIVTTRKAPSNNPNKVRMYIRSDSDYKRKKPFSIKEKQAQELFKQRQAIVQELMATGQCRSRAEAWRIAKMQCP